MSTPTPRPALRKAADAHVHPAAPGHSARQLRHAADLPVPRPDSESAPPAEVAEVAPVGKPSGKGHRLSGPPSGTTSDMLRAAGKRGRRQARGLSAEKSVELTVKIPKSLRKEFRAAVKANRADADEVITSLLRAWLHG